MNAKPIPDGYHAVTPYLIVDDGRQLIDFLVSVFGAEMIAQMSRPDGKMGHTEMKIGDSPIMMGESLEGFSPLTSMLYIYVDDVDATYAAAIAAGAKPLMPVADQFYGDRSGGFEGPGGNKFWVATHIEDVSNEEIERRSQARGKTD